MYDAAKALTIPDLAAMKRRDEKIVALTAYDASFAKLMDDAGVDLVLVGDSLGMVVQGEPTTLPVTLDDMVYHTRCVARGIRRAVLAADMPFASYSGPAQAIDSAARLIRGGAHMVKIEGGRKRVEIVRALVEQNIPVCGHLGLLPQSVHQVGGYLVQGKEEKAAQAILEDALILQEAGISVLVLECVPATLAGEITAALDIPTIGIGAGPGCGGQILVLYDMLGITPGKRPKFSRNFLQGAEDIPSAIRNYADDVRSGRFPALDHSF
ncbi:MULTISPECIES: 3-methyl-2-oxobutanoate hydroxymethyltransferase [Methylocaldum]|jgi:3-methyl-2-oxobutanoate hydroxymethyltransferase|uniref:3-methyl-2-oxobutanoate hydroxymethyltransferase n=1 Tax=unclassified Methylocaldum TaxID=2622260 RepID=UPI00098B47B5|nr:MULTISPECIES: 3-methyl-2-oxobutanoate hydroxymethyltransferase [unclassified Methylocaldum]MBP1148431.1 3-methyl-2-oxobutanoate hydroxymethyltransferase [Methylocaldum sp. RMAD-M]MVF22060.1 3-methyl-2-oxobutanoate hydroxymethyltransferase [Methylocaldum sp. BRCS4]